MNSMKNGLSTYGLIVYQTPVIISTKYATENDPNFPGSVIFTHKSKLSKYHRGNIQIKIL